MKDLIERIKTWWREAERRERHRRMHLYYELGGEHLEEEWLVNPTLPTSRYYFGPF
jgi:hypothetical protein